MKRLNWLAVPFALTIAFGLGACGGDNDNDGGDEIDGGGGGGGDIDGGGGGGGDIDGGGGGGGGEGFTLTFNGEGFGGPHQDQEMHFALWDDAVEGEAVLTDSVTVPTGANVEMTWEEALEEGHTYELHYYADVNDNGECDGPKTNQDHAWMEAIEAVSADVTLEPTHNIDFDGDCAKF